MTKGDIILVEFPFTDLSGSKLRPALVLAEKMNDVLTAFITTKIDELENDDLLIKADSTNNLKQDSRIRLFRLATLKKNLIVGKIGYFDNSTIKLIDQKLKKIFRLN